MVTLQAAFAAMVLSGTGQTAMLDFYADWCAPCRAMNPTIQALEKAGYPVQRVNIDQNKPLAEQYKVKTIPCFIMVVDGQVVDRVDIPTTYTRLERMCKLGASAPAQDRSPPMLAQNGLPPAQPAPSFPVPPSPFDGRASQSATIQPVSAPARQAGGVTDATLIAATVRLQVQDSGGRSCGSGTIIDSNAREGKALILTCGHIFRDSQGKGPITVDLFGPNAAQQVRGNLVSFDLDRDVGLVWISTPGPVTAARVTPPGYQVTRGMPVVSVGCNNGDMPTAQHSYVTSLDKFVGPPNIQVAGQPMEGRSGGGLFSSEGYVIGICDFADPSDREGLFAAPASIYAELDRKTADGRDLSFVYKSPAGIPAVFPVVVAPAAPPAFAANVLPAMPKAMPGPINLASMGAVAAPAAASPLGLPPHERAAYEEIQRYLKEGAEVTCVIRPRDKPNAKSEVIMLDHVSPEFVKLLSSDARSQNRRFETSLELPTPRKKLLEWSAPDQKAPDGGWKAGDTR